MNKIYRALCLIFLKISTYAIAVQPSQAIPEITFEFIGDTYCENAPARIFRMRVPSCVKDTQAMFCTKQLNKKARGSLVRLSKDGSLRTDDSSKKFAMAFIAGYGERNDILLFEVDKKGNPIADKLIARGSIIPFPLQAQDNQGHTVEIHLNDGNGEIFMINYSGFAPNEQIQFDSYSSKESISYTITADENGLGAMLYAPAVAGRKEGPFEIRLKTKNMPQPLVIKHYWGKIAFETLDKYHELEKKYPRS